jgi:hypothetical protein
MGYYINWNSNEVDRCATIDSMYDALKKQLILSHWKIFYQGNLDTNYKVDKMRIKNGFKHGDLILMVTEDFSIIKLEKIEPINHLS